MIITGVCVTETVSVCDGRALSDVLLVTDGVSEMLSEIDGVCAIVAVGDDVVVALCEKLRDCERLVVPLKEGLSVTVGTGEGVSESEGV